MNDDLIRQLSRMQLQIDGLIKPEIPLAAGIRPLFSAYNSATDSNVTGDGTDYTVICDTEIVDVNSNYNAATGIFTAPVTGYYLLVGEVYLRDIAAGHTQGLLKFITSNRNYNSDRKNVAAIADSSNDTSLKIVAIVDMDASDTAYLLVRVSNGALQVDVYGAAAVSTFFQGYLLP